MIPSNRTLYLELAKLKPSDRNWLRTNLKQVGRLLQKEMAAAGMATNSKA